MKYVFLDTETTGLNPDRHEVGRDDLRTRLAQNAAAA